MNKSKLTRVVFMGAIGWLAILRCHGVPLACAAPASPGRIDDEAAIYLPPDPNIVMRIRLDEIAKLQEYQPVFKLAKNLLANIVNVAASDIDELWLVSDSSTGLSFSAWSQLTGHWGLIVHAKVPFSASLPDREGAPKPVEITDGDVHFLLDAASRTAWGQLEPATAVVGNRSFVEETLRRKPKNRPAMIAAQSWGNLRASHVLIATRGKPMASLLYSLADLRREGRLVVAALAPMWDEARYYHVGIHCADRLSVAAIAESEDAAKATKVQQTMSSAVVLTKNLLTGPPLPPWPGVEPEEPSPFGAISAALLANAKVDQPLATSVRLRCSAINPQLLVSTVSEVTGKARSSAIRNLASNNLRQIALAMHNHHDVFKRFPGAAAPWKAEGPPISWRVRILPYLGEATLYNRYKKDEPWDSEANRKLLAEMPAVFRAPGDDPNSTNAGYYAVVGEKTVFGNPKGSNFKDIVDGTSRTILVVEAKRDIPWTKPEDIDYDAAQPLPELGGWQENGFLAALADGSVHFIPSKLNEKVLKAFLSRAGREPDGVDALKVK